MKFQICTCKKHPFIHGNFFDETGPYIKEAGGLVHLSGDMFSQADARAFIQAALDSGNITLEEAYELGRGQAICSLPEARPSNLALYEKNETARIKRMVTPEGLRQLATIRESKYSIKRFFIWCMRYL